MGFFDKIKAGLTKTREALSGTLGSVFSGFSEIDDDFYDELEESLILADLGVDTSVKAVGRLRKAVREQHLKTTEEAREALKEILVDMLSVGDTELNLSTHPSVILVIGVNGVGKTTTIGKIAKQLTSQGKKVMLVAGDTFRAAAADQLEIWAGRSGASIVRQHEGADPASVVFDGIQSAKARDVDVILIDTAGRLHNKTNLMNELNKISRIVARELPDAAKEVLLVLHHRPERPDSGKAVQGNCGGHGHCPDQAGRHRQGRHRHRRGGRAANPREVCGRGGAGRRSDALQREGIRRSAALRRYHESSFGKQKQT